MTRIVRLEEAQRVTLFRLNTDRPEIRLALPVVRYVEGPPGQKGDKGDPGADGANGAPGDNTLGGVPVDLAGLGPGDTVVYDPAAGKFVNGQPMSFIDGGAF